MVDGSSRLGAFVRILLPLVAPGLVATSVFVFITSWNEYIFAQGDPHGSGEPDPHGLALVLLRHGPEHGLGRAHGRIDPDRDSCRHLLPAGAAEDRLRTDGRRSQSVSAELGRLAAHCIFPGFEGPVVPDWVRRRLAEGLGGVVLYAWNVESVTSCGR